MVLSSLVKRLFLSGNACSVKLSAVVAPGYCNTVSGTMKLLFIFKGFDFIKSNSDCCCQISSVREKELFRKDRFSGTEIIGWSLWEELEDV